MDVMGNFPTDVFQDFLLGTPQRVFHDIDELVEVVQANINERMNVSRLRDEDLTWDDQGREVA